MAAPSLKTPLQPSLHAKAAVPVARAVKTKKLPAELLKRFFVYNTLLTTGLHDSWQTVLFADTPNFSTEGLLISRQIEAKLKLPKARAYEYQDPLQWLAFLDEEEFHSVIMTLGALSLAPAIKHTVLKSQVTQLRALLGSSLYQQVLLQELGVLAQVHHVLDGDEAELHTITPQPFYLAASRVLAAVFADQSVFFKQRLALRLPYSSVEFITAVRPQPALPPELMTGLREAVLQVLNQVSPQWQKWSA